MVAERLVGDMRSSHGWKHWAAEWLGWITETWSNYRALLVEVTDVADVQVRKPDIQVDNDVGDVTTLPVFTELSPSWCECDAFAFERVNCTIILRAVLVVVLESCERYFDSVCLNMFGLAQRVHIPSVENRTTLSTCTSRKRQQQVNWTRDKDVCIGGVCCLRCSNLNSGSMSKDMRVLMRKDLQQLSCFDSCWCWSVFAASTVVFVSLESSEVVPQTVVSRHGVDTHERIGRASFQLD